MSKALVVVERPDELTLRDALPDECRLFLDALCDPEGDWTVVWAARALDIDIKCHRNWRRKVPGYTEAYDEAKEDEIKYLWLDLYARRAKQGFTEREYDGKENLKRVRVRESENALTKQMTYVAPEFQPDRSKGSTNVVIVLNEKKEGGW